MAYIDSAYYKDTFKGRDIPEDDFERLADIASDFINGICYVKPDSDMKTNPEFKKAVAYQIEFMYEQGGVDAILGRSEASLAGGSESLGDYSISTGSSAQRAVEMYNGIPISSMTIMLLEQLGLMTRWVYAACHRKRGKHGHR